MSDDNKSTILDSKKGQILWGLKLLLSKVMYDEDRNDHYFSSEPFDELEKKLNSMTVFSSTEEIIDILQMYLFVMLDYSMKMSGHLKKCSACHEH